MAAKTRGETIFVGFSFLLERLMRFQILERQPLKKVYSVSDVQYLHDFL
jgi:hypothetical protein